MPFDAVRITPAKALELNPFLPLGLFLDEHGKFYRFYTCSHLRDGLCSIYEDRPEICRGYPFYGNLEIAHSFLFPVPWCRYREDALILQGIPYAFCEKSEIEAILSSEPDCCFFVGGLKSGRQYPAEYLPARGDFGKVLPGFFETGEAPLTLASVPSCLVQKLKDLYRAKFFEVYRREPARFNGSHETHLRKAILFCFSFGLNVETFFDLVCRFSWGRGKKFLIPVNHLNSEALRLFVMNQISRYGQIR